jgi:hypothetical protein
VARSPTTAPGLAIVVAAVALAGCGAGRRLSLADVRKSPTARCLERNGATLATGASQLRFFSGDASHPGFFWKTRERRVFDYWTNVGASEGDPWIIWAGQAVASWQEHKARDPTGYFDDAVRGPIVAYARGDAILKRDQIEACFD